MGPHAQLSKKQKKNIFTVPFLGPSGGIKNETAKSTAKADPSNKNYNCVYLSKKAYRFGSEEARTCEA